jgi:NADH-quinone oxidoreductase subunit M
MTRSIEVPLAGQLEIACRCTMRRSTRTRSAGGVAATAGQGLLVTSVLLYQGSGFTTAPAAAVQPWHAVRVDWVPGLDLQFHLGVDGISYPLVVLTTLLTLLCCAYTLWTACPTPRTRAHRCPTTRKRRVNTADHG